jgi:hypothetical protein
MVCIRNDGYEASLERNKIYVIIPDDDAKHDGDLRVTDESGEDYLFSADHALNGHWKTTALLAALRHDRTAAPAVLDGPPSMA